MQRSASANHGQHVGGIRFIGAHHRRDNLGVFLVALGKERPAGAVDQAGGRIPVPEIEPETEEEVVEVPPGGWVAKEPPPVERKKFYFDGGQVEVVAHVVFDLDADGRQLRMMSLTDYVADKVRTLSRSSRELREEWERLVGELKGRVTHAEGIFPFVRILSNVVVRELQTMAILLDIYLGVPVIYSTYMQYDELAHHFGPTSRMALTDMRRTDARINEIWRMIRLAGGRGYDLVVLSDHGMTPSRSYRVEYGESLGRTVQRILDGDPVPTAGTPRGIGSSSSISAHCASHPEVRGIANSTGNMSTGKRIA